MPEGQDLTKSTRVGKNEHGARYGIAQHFPTDARPLVLYPSTRDPGVRQTANSRCYIASVKRDSNHLFRACMLKARSSLQETRLRVCLPVCVPHIARSRKQASKHASQTNKRNPTHHPDPFSSGPNAKVRAPTASNHFTPPPPFYYAPPLTLKPHSTPQKALAKSPTHPSVSFFVILALDGEPLDGERTAVALLPSPASALELLMLDEERTAVELLPSRRCLKRSKGRWKRILVLLLLRR